VHRACGAGCSSSARTGHTPLVGGRSREWRRLRRAVTLDEVSPGNVHTVGAIRVQGNAAISRRAVRNVMLTSAPFWYKP